MTNPLVFTLAFAAALSLVGMAPTAAFAQAGFAPLDAMDELNAAPVGGGGAFGGAVDRARGVTNMTQGGFGANDPFGAEGGGGMVDSPFGPGGGAFGPGGFGPNAFGPNAFGPGGQPGVQAYVPPATVRAWGGERVVQFNPDPEVDIQDYLPSDILADAREIRVLATAQGNYPNVVKIGNDDVFTNIRVRRDYISPEAHVVRTRLITTLEFMSTLNPREFALVRVATTEPTSPFPKMIDLEAEQDLRLEQWLNDFMAPYLRTDEESGEVSLVPTFLAPPPLTPNIPLPLNFNPSTEAPAGQDQQGGQGIPGGFGGGQFGGDGMFGGDVTGDPMGAASSRYF
jgi:hypothetical protein